jgi:hypothetical protein
MSKEQRSKKEGKKKLLLNPKEKKAAKREKNASKAGFMDATRK